LDRLLLAIGRCCHHECGSLTDADKRATVGQLAEGDRSIRDTYLSESNAALKLHDDLTLLAKNGRIEFTSQTGPSNGFGEPEDGDVRSWLVSLTSEGLSTLAELEKSSLRRGYERSPAAWWLVLCTLLSVIIAAIALWQSVEAKHIAEAGSSAPAQTAVEDPVGTAGTRNSPEQ